ncbi:hypothetical protein PENTCL1PPCAC_11042, partial [Pristionchus entomophagus]
IIVRNGGEPTRTTVIKKKAKSKETATAEDETRERKRVGSRARRRVKKIPIEDPSTDPGESYRHICITGDASGIETTPSSTLINIM